MNQPRENQNTVAPTANNSASAAEPEALTGWRAFYDFVMQSYCWLLIFFILYVLSVGPLYSSWREAVQMGKRPVLQAIYLPLAGLCTQSDTINTVVEWYVAFWDS